VSFDPVPGLARAVRQRRVVAFFWVCRAVSAWLIATPLATLFAGQGVGRYPEGDALLFAPGGLHLAEAARLSIPLLGETLRSTVMIAGFFGYVLLLPLGGLVAALATNAPTSVGWSLMRGIERLPKLTVLAGFTLVTQAVVVVVGVYAVGKLDDRLNVSLLTERSRDIWSLVALALVVVCVVLIGVVQDIARMALASGERSFFGAVMTTFRTIRHRPFELLVAWLIASVWSWVSIAVVAVMVGRLDVPSGRFAPFFFVILLHQSVAFLLVLLRAAWLGRAFELAEEAASSHVPSSAHVVPAIG
jgi:hypothetical protein